MNVEEEIESIHETLLKMQAHVSALESLCFALFYASDDKPLINQHRRLFADQIENSLLHSPDMHDPVFQEFRRANEAIERQLTLIRSLS